MQPLVGEAEYEHIRFFSFLKKIVIIQKILKLKTVSEFHFLEYWKMILLI